VGFYRSTDGGDTWHDFFLSTWAINDAAIDGAYGFGDLVQVWQANGNIFRRTINATTGAQIGQSIIVNESPLDALEIVVDSNAETVPVGNEIFIACALYYNPGNQQNSLKAYRSADHGATWSPAVTLDTGPMGNGAAISHPHLSFARAGFPFFHVVYEKLGSLWHVRSTNAGTTWGVPQSLFPVTTASEVSVAAFGIFAVACGESPAGEVIYKNTTDAGVTWSATKVIDAADGGVRKPYVAWRGVYQAIYWSSGNSLATRFTTTPENQASWTAEEPASPNPTAYQPWGVGYGSSVLGAVYIRYDDDDRPYFISNTGTSTGVDDPPAVPPVAAALSAFPIPSSGPVTLVWSGGVPIESEILDAAGRRVGPRLAWTPIGEGSRAAWEGRDAQGRVLPAGVYFARIHTPAETRTTRIVLVR
jgi:hypothetical protein